MDIDEGEVAAVRKQLNGAGRGSSLRGRGGKMKPMRRGLGAPKMKGQVGGGGGGIRKERGGAFKHGLQRRRGRGGAGRGGRIA